MLVAEHRAVTAVGKIIAQRRTFAGQCQQCRRFAIEPEQVAQHAPESRRHQIAPLAEQAIEIGGVVLQAAGLVAHGETHRGRLGRDVEFREQRVQQRIVLGIVDDEAGVDRMATSVQLDIVGVRVAAQIIVRLEQHDLMVPGQQPRRCEAGDAGSDNGDAHQPALAFAATQAGTGLRSWTRRSMAIVRRP